MGIDIGPIEITDGLVFQIDAGNTRSYSGSGITVNALAGAGVTLVNGVGFGTTFLGHFLFDGSNDYIPYNISGIGNTVTVEIWARIKNFHLTMPFGFDQYDVFTYLGGMGFNTNNSDVYGISSATISGLGISNFWAHYVFEMRSDVSYTNNKIYINTNLQTLTNLIGTESAINRNFNNGLGRISGYNYNSSYKILMDLGSIKFYNRVLSPSEIFQNYTATKGRYR